MTAGVYLHVPYCRRVCPYCDFNVVSTKRPPWDALAAAMRAEMAARTPCLEGPLQSVYFGGGTPSLAPPGWLLAQLDAVRAHWPLQVDAEITLELEPNTMGVAPLRTLREGGFNRISMGWQSTHDHLLARLGRGHDAAAGRDALAAAREAGFANVSVDLMFALPGQTQAELAIDLARTVAAAPEHVSLYNLTVHANTPFGRQKARGALRVLSESQEVAMLEQACRALAEAGYERYEVANFARPKKRAVHNAGYWQGTPYLGIGPGAHSFVRDAWRRAWRWENVRRPAAYFDVWQPPNKRGTAAPGPHAAASIGVAVPRPGTEQVSFVEELDASQRMLERMLLGLRTTDGIALDEPALAPFAGKLAAGVAVLSERGWARVEGVRLRPTARGLRHADAAALLFA